MSARLGLQGLYGDPNPSLRQKVLRHKWEESCDTNGMYIAMQMRVWQLWSVWPCFRRKGREGMAAQIGGVVQNPLPHGSGD